MKRDARTLAIIVVIALAVATLIVWQMREEPVESQVTLAMSHAQLLA